MVPIARHLVSASTMFGKTVTSIFCIIMLLATKSTWRIDNNSLKLAAACLIMSCRWPVAFCCRLVVDMDPLGIPLMLMTVQRALLFLIILILVLVASAAVLGSPSSLTILALVFFTKSL